jgi:hypothetical protein
VSHPHPAQSLPREAQFRQGSLYLNHTLNHSSLLGGCLTFLVLIGLLKKSALIILDILAKSEYKLS